MNIPRNDQVVYITCDKCGRIWPSRYVDDAIQHAKEAHGFEIPDDLTEIEEF